MTRRTVLWLSAVAMLAVLVAYQVVVTSAGERDREELRQRAAQKAGFVREGEVETLCLEQKASLRVRTPDLGEPVLNLSGGNQQKAVLARALVCEPRVLILDEPTRGIDVGAKAEIHRLISELAGKGVAVLMISSELPEVLGMSDRVLVMHEGRMTGIVDRKDATQVKIMELASQ